MMCKYMSLDMVEDCLRSCAPSLCTWSICKNASCFSPQQTHLLPYFASTSILRSMRKFFMRVTALFLLAACQSFMRDFILSLFLSRHSLFLIFLVSASMLLNKADISRVVW